MKFNLAMIDFVVKIKKKDLVLNMKFLTYSGNSNEKQHLSLSIFSVSSKLYCVYLDNKRLLM